MHTTRRRRARFLMLLLAIAVLLGVGYGVLTGILGEPAGLLTWWGAFLRGVVAVLVCFVLAGAIDRRLERRS